MNAAEISRLLAQNIEALARELMPNGHKEGAEWRCGSVAGEAGDSLGVHLRGHKAGLWKDFQTGEAGDALDLIAAVNGTDLKEALRWARCWLRIDDGALELPRRRRSTGKPKTREADNPERWRRPWIEARSIERTLAGTYLDHRGRRFWHDLPEGSVLRFLPRQPRKNPETDQLEYHPALLGLFRDVRSGQACGIHNIYLRADGSDRLRDRKAKTSWGRAQNAGVMLNHFGSPVGGLVICEGIETGIALSERHLRPIWALTSASNISVFPVLGGIEVLTIAADSDEPGQKAAATCAERWRTAGREVLIITPTVGDWADGWRPEP
jgi:hypothetical protein